MRLFEDAVAPSDERTGGRTGLGTAIGSNGRHREGMGGL